MPIETVDLVSSQATTEREEVDTLPEIFWENTKLRPRAGIEAAVRRIQWFFGDARKVLSARQSYKTYATVPRLPLPDPFRARAPFASFDQVVLSRRSALLAGTGPVFSADPVPLEHLSDLLYYTYGVIRATPEPAGECLPAPAAEESDGVSFRSGATPASPDMVGDQKARATSNSAVAQEAAEVRRRVVPSGGALYPLELYAVVVNVEGLTPGVYHYNAFDHHLEQLRATEAPAVRAQLEQMVTTGLNYEGVAVMLVITVTPLRATFKYGDRGFRLLLVECGHAAQNAYLSATALGVSACAIAGFYDDEVDRYLGINGLDEFSAYVLLLGMPLAPGETGDAA